MSIYTNKKKIEDDYMKNYFHPSSKTKNHLSQLRICGTTNKKSSYVKKNNLGAVSVIGKLWSDKNIKNITVKFLSEPNYNPDPISGVPAFENTFNDENYHYYDEDDNGNTVYYDPFETDFLNTTKPISCIKKIVRQRIEPICNLKFIFKPKGYKGPTDIRIGFETTKGCNSLIGTDCLLKNNQNEATMNFAWFDVGTVIHEFGHAIGLDHEHQSPFSNPIIWNLPELYSWGKETQNWDPKTVDTQIIEPINNAQGTYFDIYSIMLYFFPKSVTLDQYGICCGEGTRQNRRLSPLDVLYINYLYPNSLSAKETPQQFYERVYQQNIDDLKLEDYLYPI